MKVYLLRSWYWDYDAPQIMGAYSTKDAAEKAANNGRNCNILEFEVDAEKSMFREEYRCHFPLPTHHQPKKFDERSSLVFTEGDEESSGIENQAFFFGRSTVSAERAKELCQQEMEKYSEKV